MRLPLRSLGRARKSWLVFGIIAISALLVAGALYLPPLSRVALLGSSYMAQQICAGVFISKRSFSDVLEEDLSGPGLEPLQLFTPDLDRETQQVSASAFGLFGQTAIYRQGLGCTLLHGRSASALRAEAKGLFALEPPLDNAAEWPQGTRVAPKAFPDGVDGKAASRAIDEIFAQGDPARPRATRALVVVHRGRIVAERYAPGFDAAMALPGWSMSKTATGALVGLRIKDGALSLEQAGLMPEWRGAADPRRAITVGELMRMISGLAFDENPSDKLSDVSQMMFVQGNTAKFAAEKPLDHAPGSHWSYSSGATAILSGILRETFEEERTYWRFPKERLFGPLGMRTAQLAPDADGTFVGAAFLYASARDWARLGLLLLQDGQWQGKQLLPKGWAAYMTRPTPQSPQDRYGAQMWLKLPSSPGLGEPPMPEDTSYMLGFDGQVVAIVPSRNLVVVRLGRTKKGGDWDPARELAPLVNAFPHSSSSSR